MKTLLVSGFSSERRTPAEGKYDPDDLTSCHEVVERKEVRMVRPLMIGSAVWPSVTGAGADRNSDCNQGNDIDRAIADYTKDIESNPNDATAYTNRGVAYGRKGAFDRAIADFTKAIALDPNDATAYTSRGSAYYEKAEFDRAVADFNKAIEINPKFAPPLLQPGLDL